MKRLLVFLLTLVLIITISGCGKSKPATEVDQLISNIGDVTLESEEAIVAAEEYYDTLSSGQKDEVENYKTLVDARKAYDELVAEEMPILGKWTQTQLVDTSKSDPEPVDLDYVESVLGDIPRIEAEFTKDHKFTMKNYHYDDITGTWEVDKTILTQSHRTYNFTASDGEKFQGMQSLDTGRLTIEKGKYMYILTQE